MPNQPLQTLLTQTPEEGYALAVELAQKGVLVTQPSKEVREVLRPVYSRDANSLIAASQVISIHFQTIAAANNYWRTWAPYYQ
ncbi:hexameric tyrosine-coordinated heme protein [Sporosarcina sp.]|uniref:hexameric tyrosine-coordinated heme protein n=1 Tax=Sporosarcina sp. TaxID=49982 RepID=UPI0026326D59|nr:hexameric tyrosine-coordinated heme protein [Sporosarcina sp.]